MAISLKTAGAWVENVAATPTVTLTGTPAAGDRYYVFATWKTYTITASMPAGWHKVAEYTDGAVATGNGTGSMKVACWYRNWQSGDTNPTLTFSTATNLLSVYSCHLWQKGAGEVWGDPSFKTAAWPAQTTGAINAPTTGAIPDGSVVMELMGFRNDTALMTRGTTTAVSASPSLTWNGNWVESPATHHSSVTGNDFAADLGHRFVTTGHRATTLSANTTLSTAETGAILWVIQPFAASALTESLVDNFASDDTAKWDSSAGATIVSGQLSIVADGNFYRRTSDLVYNLRGSSVVVEAVSPANAGVAGGFTMLAVQNDDANRMWMSANFGNLRIYQTWGGVEANGFETTFDLVAHRWWRIRESGGTVYWDTSPDGLTWTNRNSYSTPDIALTNVEVVLQAGAFSGGPYTAILDNFNTVPAVANPGQFFAML